MWKASNYGFYGFVISNICSFYVLCFLDLNKTEGKVNFEFINTLDGKELVVYNYVIDDPGFYQFFNTTSFCKCRNACKATKLCQTVSMHKEKGRNIDCRLSAYYLYSLKMRHNEGSFAYAKADSWIHWLGNDAQFYLVYSHSGGLLEQKKFCQKYRNGRLLMLKTQLQMDSFNTYLYSHYWVGISFILDLQPGSNDDKDLVWGDGTHFRDTYPKKMLDSEFRSTKSRVYKAIFREEKIELIREMNNLTSWHACQLNPFDSW